jgi:hypothetical protein
MLETNQVAFIPAIKSFWLTLDASVTVFGFTYASPLIRSLPPRKAKRTRQRKHFKSPAPHAAGFFVFTKTSMFITRQSAI